MALQDLRSLNSSQLRSFLDSFDTVLCDCDGVLYIADELIPGANKTILKLRERGKVVHFVSNNSCLGLNNFYEKLHRLEIDAKLCDIAFPSMAIISYLKKIRFDKEIFIIGTSFQRKEFAEAGFTVADPGPDKLEESVLDLARNIDDGRNVGAVVIDVDFNLNFAKLQKSLAYLQHPEVLFITGATDRKAPIGLSVPLIGPKVFQDTLAEFTNRTPLEFGKPALNLIKFITEKFLIENPSRTLFVGDYLDQDMEFASKGGYQKLMVLTGQSSLKEAQECPNSNRIPDFYINSFGELHELINYKLNV